METYPVSAEGLDHSWAFEIDSLYASPRQLAELLAEVYEVSDIVLSSPLESVNDILIDFKYQDREFVVWYPQRDGSRYWIGPLDDADQSLDVQELIDTIEDYEPPRWRRMLGFVFLRCINPILDRLREYRAQLGV